MAKVKKVLLALSLTLVLAACGGAQTEGEGGAEVGATEGKDHLVVAQQEDAPTLDPVEQTTIYAENVIRQIYDTLLVRLPDGSMEYRLAESIEQPDELTYVINLKPDVTFSNGEAFTSEDVQYTLERAAASDAYAYIFEKIDPATYDAADPLVLSFKLKEADQSFKNALSHPGVSMVDKTTTEAAGGSLSEEPVGTGPFKLDQWNKLDSMELSYNENYWGEEPAFHTMTVRIIPEASNRVIELESGQVDLALEISPSDVEKIEANEQLAIHRKLDNSIHFVGMNMTRPPFDNVKAREAMYYAVDMGAVIDAVYMGAGQVATGPINPNFDYSIASELPAIERDVEKAKALLTEAGVEEGTVLKMYTSQDQKRKDMATIIQSQLAEVGITLEITSLEWGAYVDALKNKEDDFFIMSWTPSIVDPHYTLYSPYHTANMGVGPNYMYYSNPELDALIDKGIQVSGEERAQIYGDVQRLLMEDKPVIYAQYGEQIIGTQSNVKNFDVDPSGSNEYYHIRFE